MQPVWYAAYGSNLTWSRFRLYIHGGELAGRTYRGCRLKQDPLDTRPVEIKRELYFAGWSSVWHGSMAFIGDNLVRGKPTKARVYLLELEQVADIVAQENGSEPGRVRIDLDALASNGHVNLLDLRAYGRVVLCGDIDGLPIVTCTSDHNREASPPAELYLEVISRGLGETWLMTAEQIADYLVPARGVVGVYTVAQLRDIASRGLATA